MKSRANISYQSIDELSGYTTAPVIEIMRTLLKCKGDIAVARAALTKDGFGRAVDRKVAGNPATSLVSEGAQFTCETTESAHWRFRVPPNSVSRVAALGPLSRRRRQRVSV